MRKITDKQRDFIKTLLGERDLSGVDSARVDALYKSLSISEDQEEFGLGSEQASQIIEWLLTRPRAQQEDLTSYLGQIPQGRYAVENDEGELRFYNMWVSKDGKRRNLYILFGPSEGKLFRGAQEGICRKIIEAGVRECAIRFGNEIGACSSCGRRLTNRISRELGIGPICGGRYFEDDRVWKLQVLAARERILARGENPDEELETEHEQMSA